MLNGARKISTLSHPLVKRWVRLRESSKEREESGLLLVAGEHLLRELGPFEAVIATQARVQEGVPETKELYIVTEAVLKKVTGQVHPQAIAALLPLPRPTLLEGCNWVVCFDGVSDPGNMGTLLRTADALGWEGVFFLPGCVDPFHERVVRASKGALFHLPFQRGEVSELEAVAKGALLTADLRGEPLASFGSQKRCFLVLGNEGEGVQPSLKRAARAVTIPLKSQVESLNVAVAGGILLYFLRGTCDGR